jgi:hypothetical protein
MTYVPPYTILRNWNTNSPKLCPVEARRLVFPGINNPATQLAGCLSSPSDRLALHTALAVAGTSSDTVVKMHHPARGFGLKKARCPVLRRFGFYVSELWGRILRIQHRVGKTKTTGGGLRVVIATGAGAAASTSKNCLLDPSNPPFFTLYSVSGSRLEWVGEEEHDVVTAGGLWYCPVTAVLIIEVTAVSGHSHSPRQLGQTFKSSAVLPNKRRWTVSAGQFISSAHRFTPVISRHFPQVLEVCIGIHATKWYSASYFKHVSAQRAETNGVRSEESVCVTGGGGWGSATCTIKPHFLLLAYEAIYKQTRNVVTNAQHMRWFSSGERFF